MAEVLFYHLTRSSLEATLPGLLERCLTRGWRVVVRSGIAERVAALDTLLWTQSEESFLPHGVAGPMAERQPVYLTAGREMPNRPQVLFLIDGAAADPGEMAGLTRSVLIFDGRDPDAVATARTDWKAATAAGLPATYWAEGDAGWQQKAKSGG